MYIGVNSCPESVDVNCGIMPYTIKSVNAQKGIKIIHLNSRSVLQHFEELHSVFLDGSIEIAILTESWLHSNCADTLIGVHGYTLHRLDRQVTTPSGATKKGGGIVVYVKDGISVTPWPSLNVSDQDIESISLTCKAGMHRNINITAVYRPPTGRVQTAVDRLESIIEAIKSTTFGNTLVVGDLNIDLLTDNIYTRKLRQFTNSCRLRQIGQN